jgi:hypothetical protein
LAPADKEKLNDGLARVEKIKEQVENLRKDIKNAQPTGKE